MKEEHLLEVVRNLPLQDAFEVFISSGWIVLINLWPIWLLVMPSLIFGAWLDRASNEQNRKNGWL